MGQVEEAAEDLPEEPTQDQEASETEEQYDDGSRPGSPLEEDPVPVPSRSPVPGPSTPAAAAPTPTPIGKRRRPQPRAEPTAVEQAILFALKERPVPPPTATREFSHIEYYLLSLAPSLERLSFYDLEKIKARHAELNNNRNRQLAISSSYWMTRRGEIKTKILRRTERVIAAIEASVIKYSSEKRLAFDAIFSPPSRSV
uniref:Uncharacterized protein n=1 Tax=Knipowitschia caucasica TaxID=637954 RepID=A0AAV2LEH4_KNICA